MITFILVLLILIVVSILVLAIGTSIAILQWIIPALIILLFMNIVVKTIKKWFDKPKKE